MANLYVLSTGSNTSPYDTWAKAATTLLAATTIATAADTIYVRSTHTETLGGTTNYAFPQSAEGLRIISVSDSNEPPTTPAIGGTVTSTGAFNITFNGKAYIYGMTFRVGSAGATNIQVGFSAVPGALHFDTCVLHCNSTHAGGQIQVGYASATTSDDIIVTFRNTSFQFNNTSQEIALRSGPVRFYNCSVAGSTISQVFLCLVSNVIDVICEGCNFSLLPHANLINVGVASTGRVLFKNCKIPASVSKSTGTLPGSGAVTVTLDNCSNSAVNYEKYYRDYKGILSTETTIVRTGGASDGVTPLSWLTTTTANSKLEGNYFRSPEIVRWNETVGSPITVTVEIVHDSVGTGTAGRVTNRDIYLEVQYLGTSTSPLSLFVNDGPSDILAAGSDQTDSTEVWTTTGLTTPLKQKLSVTFTPEMIGYIHAVVCAPGVSQAYYIDPKLTVS